MTTMLSPEELTSRYKWLVTLLDAGDDEPGPDLMEALAQFELDEAGAVESLVRLVHRHEARAAAKVAEARAIREQAAVLQGSANAAENKVALLKGRLLAHLEARGLKSMEAGPFSIRWQRNGTPKVLSCPPAAELPEQFRRVKVEADFTALIKAWKEADPEFPADVIIEVGKSLRFS